ncbi:MAG TPA: CPBP family intramembrane metalloprotease [Candidatus Sabulitectum sp.]|nr:CPBP family intramembrane metalloprotease [Candidatus Sabulitectum sp.]
MTVKKRHPGVLLLLALLYLLAGGILAIGIKLGLDATGIRETIPGRFLQLILQVGAILYFYRLYLKRHEGTGPGREYPRRTALRGILTGLAAGTALVCIQTGILAIAGSYSIASVSFSAAVLEYLFLMILVGFLEELVTRGVIFRLVERWAGSVIAIAVVSLEGALTHATNPNSTFWTSAAVGLEFGVMMTLVYMATRDLWTVSALHFAWNFTMGGIFGVNVSGTESSSLLSAEISGPDWLTGGSFGMEAGTPAIILTILLCLYLVIKLRKEKGFQRRS